MITKDVEYSLLRQEILELENIISNYIIAMYTITIAIFGIALETKSYILFLLPYIVLFSFQRNISSKRDGILRIAAYISVYLEEGVGWESNYHNIINQTCLKNTSKDKISKLMNIALGRISSTQLGGMCSIASIIVCCIENNINLLNIQNVKLVDSITIIAAISLFVAMYFWNKDALKAMKKRDVYIESLKYDKIIREKSDAEQRNGS